MIFYGDKNNWWATYAFWVFQLFGFTNAKILDGGMSKWEQEGRAFVEAVPHYRAVLLHGAGARRRAHSHFPRRRAGALGRETSAHRCALA